MPLDSTNYVEAKPDSQVVTDLLALRALLSDPARWCQHSGALNAAGLTVSPADHRAVRYCLYGGIWKVTGLKNRSALGERHDALKAAVDREAGMDAWIFNNSNPHGSVIALLDRTIARERGS